MWFNMKEWSLEAAQSAGKVSIKRILQCDSATAFKAFNDENIHHWFGDIESASWISSETKKVGAVRQVNLNIMNVREHFMIWEEHKRFTFYIKEATLPLLKSMIEDCQFKDLEDGTCAFQWDIYFKPKFLSPILTPVNKMIYKRMFGKGTDALEQYVKTL